MAVLSAAISSAPRAEPWEPAVPWAEGAGHAMIVRRRMNDGLSVTFWAARIASLSAARSSTYSEPPRQSTVWTCQPSAS